MPAKHLSLFHHPRTQLVLWCFLGGILAPQSHHKTYFCVIMRGPYGCLIQAGGSVNSHILQLSKRFPEPWEVHYLTQMIHIVGRSLTRHFPARDLTLLLCRWSRHGEKLWMLSLPWQPWCSRIMFISGVILQLPSFFQWCEKHCRASSELLALTQLPLEGRNFEWKGDKIQSLRQTLLTWSFPLGLANVCQWLDGWGYCSRWPPPLPGPHLPWIHRDDHFLHLLKSIFESPKLGSHQNPRMWEDKGL